VRALRGFWPWPIEHGERNRTIHLGHPSPRPSLSSAWWQCGSGARIEFREALGREDVAFVIIWWSPLAREPRIHHLLGTPRPVRMKRLYAMTYFPNF